MILRVLNLAVICVLILAAAYVYRIKFESTVQAERLAKIRGELRRERDTIAALRAQWGELENPARIEALSKRFLALKPVAPTQFDQLNQLPDRPPQFIRPDSPDPIGAAIQNLEERSAVTGSVPPSASPAAPPGGAAPDAPADIQSNDMPPNGVEPADMVPADDADETGAAAVKSKRLDR